MWVLAGGLPERVVLAAAGWSGGDGAFIAGLGNEPPWCWAAGAGCGQAGLSVQVPRLATRPRLSSRHRFSAAARVWIHQLLAVTPR